MAVDLSIVLVQILRNQLRMIRILIFHGRDETEVVLRESNDMIDEANELIEEIEKPE